MEHSEAKKQSDREADSEASGATQIQSSNDEGVSDARRLQSVLDLYLVHMGFEVPSRVVYTRKSLSNRAHAKDRQDAAQTRAAPAKLVRITGAFFRSCRGVQQQSEIDHEKSVWVQGLRNHHNCTISSTWQSSGAKTNPQILRMRRTLWRRCITDIDLRDHRRFGFSGEGLANSQARRGDASTP